MHLWGPDGHLVESTNRPLTRDFADEHPRPATRGSEGGLLVGHDFEKDPQATAF